LRKKEWLRFFAGMRCDCVTETSASFAARAVVTGNASDITVATNL
jgi:hypothetical protein